MLKLKSEAKELASAAGDAIYDMQKVRNLVLVKL